MAEEAIVLVAGARAAAVHDVLTALLPGRRPLPYTPRSTYVVLRGASRTATASFSCLTASGTGPPRPLRRVELALSDALLERVTLVGVRAVPAGSGHRARLVADLVRQCESVILVTDGRGPYQPAEVDLLRCATELGKGVFFAVTHADEEESWPEVVRCNQKTLARGQSESSAVAGRGNLAFLPWHTVSRSGASVLELRDSVLAWSRDQRRPRRRRAPAIQVAPDAADSGWRDVLRVEVDRAHRRAVACVEREMAYLRARIADGTICVEELGRRLRTLSVALAAEARTAVDAAIETVLRLVLVRPPSGDVIDRVSVALQRDVAERSCGSTTCLRALRITGTAAAAIATARDAVAAGSLLPDRNSGVLPPLSIGLTTNCVPMMRVAAERELAWVSRAVDSLERELDRELSRQFTYLGQATSDLIADGLDHDLLLV